MSASIRGCSPAWSNPWPPCARPASAWPSAPTNRKTPPACCSMPWASPDQFDAIGGGDSFAAHKPDPRHLVRNRQSRRQHTRTAPSWSATIATISTPPSAATCPSSSPAGATAAPAWNTAPPPSHPTPGDPAVNRRAVVGGVRKPRRGALPLDAAGDLSPDPVTYSVMKQRPTRLSQQPVRLLFNDRLKTKVLRTGP